jgi:alkanesulfonate monooxygenase SsuD/methylene tetrahydromethanopterin reductase-like flavin-dependent oxidoreductase (luciferase family)
LKISIVIETMFGMTWANWKQMVPELEAMGFAAIYTSNHFPLGLPGATNALELITSLTYLAEHTHSVDFGSLVAPLSFNDPVILARQAMSLNDLSDGRMILGLGAGWMETEHTAFGYSLGDMKTRFDRLEEGLEVITSLVRDEQPVSFQGKFFKLQEARLLPRPKHPTRILVGGSGLKRTLPLVARYADISNFGGSVESFRGLSAKLDALLLAVGRQPGDVKRTTAFPVVFDPERMLDLMNSIPMLTPTTAEGLNEMISSMNGVIGAPEKVVERIQAYADAGVEEFIVQWFNPHDWKGLEILARDVVPKFI